jgi:TolB protein
MLALCALAFAPAAPADAAFPGANGKLAFNGLPYNNTDPYIDHDIFTVEPNGAGFADLTQTQGRASSNEYDPAWSSDGTRIAFTDQDERSEGIWVMNADGSGRYQVVPRWLECPPDAYLAYPDCTPTDPAWSPDGQRIVFDRSTGSPTCRQRSFCDRRLFIVNADGTGLTQLTTTTSPVDDFEPAWSPDGTEIAFQRYEDCTGSTCDWEIHAIRPDGTGERRITSNGVTDIMPNWSPDSTRIAFHSTLNACCIGEVYVLNRDASNLRRLTFTSSPWWAATEPAWSPDGTRIAYMSIGPGPSGADCDPTMEQCCPPGSPECPGDELFTIKPDGSGNQRVTTNDNLRETEPDWQPLVGYGRPQSATPTTVELVPAYKTCVDANGAHGSPLALSSCSAPEQVSAYATMGHGDGHPTAAKFAGGVTFKVVGERPINPSNGDQADIQLKTTLKDVRNASDYFTDYVGELRASVVLRVTDRLNGPSSDRPGTAVDTPFGFSFTCAPTADASVGSTCTVATSADAVTSGLVAEGKRAIWQLGQVEVYDGGLDLDADTAGDNTLFAVQGLFAP